MAVEDGRAQVELKISRDLHTLRVRADRLQPRAVGFRLRQKQIDMHQHFSQGPAKASVVGPGTVGDAAR